jgi:hypothetical protein
LEAGVHIVPGGIYRRVGTYMICVPAERLKVDLGCYESGMPDRFEVKISTPPTLRIQASLRDASPMWSRTPAINRRATVMCPSGTR